MRIMVSGIDLPMGQSGINWELMDWLVSMDLKCYENKTSDSTQFNVIFNVISAP